jgi:murein DD-endopeptidase MepM/ murein hydrolase activator NlpD
LRIVRVVIPASLAAAALLTALVASRFVAPSPPPLVRALPFQVVPPPAAGAALAIETAKPPLGFTLRSGETLGEALVELGLSRGEAHAAGVELARFVDPRRLKPGERYRAHYDAEERVTGLDLALAGRGELSLRREAGVWHGSFRASRRTVEVRRLAGVIEGTLDAAVRTSGSTPALAYAMAEVLQWDVDFNRDLRTGDRFEVLFEEVYLDEEYHGLGSVRALAFTNGGRRLEAYRYGDGGYYDADGRPLRKMFLRSPLRYSRITSRFSNRRFHPVLKVHRPHYGVDYGAPAGTPVLVTAAGSVVSAGWDGGGGRTVKVRHPNGYVTAYLHLSRFASGVRSGARVQQGDVVGYVGSTGLSTAAHLDYRVQRHGRWLDPLTLANTPAPPIAPAEMAAFGSWRDALRHELEGHPPPAPAVLAAAPAPVSARAGVESAGRR